jgi:hypothetical protein
MEAAPLREIPPAISPAGCFGKAIGDPPRIVFATDRSQSGNKGRIGQRRENKIMVDIFPAKDATRTYLTGNLHRYRFGDPNQPRL